ncbi:MAG: hypothetical protein INR70_31335 [Parafilimonas terrae]|nr:hypothetical protein [Parafilimonas terrae]
MRRGEAQQLDRAFTAFSLAFEAPERRGAVLAGDRAPDALLTGTGGQPKRLFELLKGPYWTPTNYSVDRAAPAPRCGLRIHAIGPYGDLLDTYGNFRAAYGVEEGIWMLVRPDGCIDEIIVVGRFGEIDVYLRRVGVGRASQAMRQKWTYPQMVDAS